MKLYLEMFHFLKNLELFPETFISFVEILQNIIIAGV